MDCATFESLLLDALDGTLTPARLSEFRGHAGDCGVCGPMFADVEHGYLALHSLDEIDPPDHLVHNIMAKTAYVGASTVKVPGAQPATGLWARLRSGILRPVLQPRFAMSMGMAVFSISLILNVAGISRKDLQELRPATAMVKFNELEGRVFKYYENLRAVYLFESYMRDKTEPKDKDTKKKQENKETSQLTRPSETPHPLKTEMRKKA